MAEDVKRMRYFDGLFLKEDEFNLEQDYHLRMRRQHNSALHLEGVLKGLEVHAGPGEKDVTITQGLALGRFTTKDKDDNDVVLLGCEIVLPEDKLMDLSDYGADDTVYIYISHSEEKADIIEEKGGLEEIHWWEKAILAHAASAPDDKQENIMLAKVKLDENGDVKADGILYSEAGTAIRCKSSLVAKGGLHVGGETDPGNDNLLVDGSCTIKGNLIVEGETTTVSTQNLEVEDNIITVNRGAPQSQSGLEVYRGETLAAAQLIWDETDAKWKAGIKGGLFDLAYGTNAAALTDNSMADSLHRHSKLVSADGAIDPVLSVDNSGNVGIGTTTPFDRLHIVAGDEEDNQTLGVRCESSTGTSSLYTGAYYGNASSTGTGIVQGLYVHATGKGIGSKYGINANASGSGDKYAGMFYASSGTGSDYTYGLYVSSDSTGTGPVCGLDVTTYGAGTGSKRGIYASVRGSGNKYAGMFYASSGTGSDYTYGLYASGSSTGTGPVYGLYVTTYGTGTNTKYGIRSYVRGEGRKYGGYFSVIKTSSETSYGIYTRATSSGTGLTYGIYSEASGSNSYAGYFKGTVHVSGTLSKSSGSFLIDHPLDPYKKTLRHSFVESPEDLCLYRGKVKLDAKGKATVKMPEYFAALTNEKEATVSLTPIGNKPFTVSYEWNKKFTAFTVLGGSDSEVSYIVLADRDDPAIHLLRRPVEEEKGDAEKDKLILPEAYKQSAEIGVDYVALEQDEESEVSVNNVKKMKEEIENREKEHKQILNEQALQEKIHSKIMKEHEAIEKMSK